MVDARQLHPFISDRGITPARIVAIGFDARTGVDRERGQVEVQYLMTKGGETPERIVELDITHLPGVAYLWNIQMRHGRAVVEGDPDLQKVVSTPVFAHVYNVLAGLLRNGNGGSEPSGEMFLVGSSKEPFTWDASGRGFTLIFGEESRRRFLRIRRHDILFAEGDRLVAAPVEALAEAGTFAKTRSVHAVNGPIAMLSKVHGRMGSRVVVSTGRNEHTEIEIGDNAADPASKPMVTRRSIGRGLFVGNTDRGRGLKALISLEIGTKGQWRLAIYPVDGPKAPEIVAARATP